MDETDRPTTPVTPAPRGRRRRVPLRSRLTSSFAGAAIATVLVLSTLAAVVAGVLASAAPTRWTTTTEIAPQLSLLDGGNGSNVFSLNIDGAKRFIDSQVALTVGRDVLVGVQGKSGLTPKELRRRIDVEAGKSGATVLITVTDADRTRAFELAGAVVTSYRTVRHQQLRAVAAARADVIQTELDVQRVLGLSDSELSLQLQRDLAAILVPLNAGPAATLTVVSSPSVPEPASNGAVVAALIAFVATSAVAGSILLLRRAMRDRVLSLGDLGSIPGMSPLGLLRRHEGDDVAAARVAQLMALPDTKPDEIVVLSALPEPLDERAGRFLLAGLLASGRPAQVLGPDDVPLPEHILISPRGWATQFPELARELSPSTVVCLVLAQGMSGAEARAAIASVRQVTTRATGLLLVQRRALP